MFITGFLGFVYIVDFTAAMGLLMVDLLVMKPLYTWPGLIIVMIGIPVYFVWRRVGVASAIVEAPDAP